MVISNDFNKLSNYRIKVLTRPEDGAIIQSMKREDPSIERKENEKN